MCLGVKTIYNIPKDLNFFPESIFAPECVAHGGFKTERSSVTCLALYLVT
jgi:hypothetical protein